MSELNVKTFAIGALALLMLTGCASGAAQRVGTAEYEPLPASAKVTVFSSEDQVKGRFETVGIVSYNNSGRFQVLSLEDAIEPLKEKARALGADAIIIDKSEPIQTGVVSTGISAEARAIRINPTTDD